ncbi:hypothetical protein ARMGADRAFT_1039608 [Armillaria gallica]|uniref:Uncharacterized protein n=1 Tax=Armillaria gallica TaxID=47427 RepID=A0A2H3CD44_ARMGA|nr:hypothetical protein ARMGADRAFT_1039608 [Armillaria gallica]
MADDEPLTELLPAQSDPPKHQGQKPGTKNAPGTGKDATPIPIEEESQQSAPAISDTSMHAPKTKSRIPTWGGMKHLRHGKGSSLPNLHGVLSQTTTFASETNEPVQSESLNLIPDTSGLDSVDLSPNNVEDDEVDNAYGSDSKGKFPDDEFDDWDDEERSTDSGVASIQPTINPAPTVSNSTTSQKLNPKHRGRPGKSQASIQKWLEVYHTDQQQCLLPSHLL